MHSCTYVCKYRHVYIHIYLSCHDLMMCQQQEPYSWQKGSHIYSVVLANRLHTPTSKFTQNSEMVRSVSNDSNNNF